MHTLDGPVYEIDQNSDWYKQTVKRDEQINEFFEEVNDKYFDDSGFSFYHSEYFGIAGDSKDYEKYKKELLKNPDKNGMYAFKKRSKHYPIFKAMIEKIDRSNPFKAHDVFGLNNITASQWIGDRWFYGVKKAESVVGPEAIALDYKDYLQIAMNALEKKEDKVL